MVILIINIIDVAYIILSQRFETRIIIFNHVDLNLAFQQAAHKVCLTTTFTTTTVIYSIVRFYSMNEMYINAFYM